MWNFDFVKELPNKFWIVLGVAALLIAFGSYNWGKANGLEECKA